MMDSKLMEKYFNHSRDGLIEEIGYLRDRLEKVQEQVDRYQGMLCPFRKSEKRTRSKRVWGEALYAHLFGIKGDHGTCAIIEKAFEVVEAKEKKSCTCSKAAKKKVGK